MKVLIIVPDYPNENCVSYKYVHERVKKYKEEIDVDVFCYNNKKSNQYLYEDVKVFAGKKKDLLTLLNNDKYDKIAFHFLNGRSALFILKYLRNKQVFVWFHGSDSLDYKRRLPRINYSKVKLINPFFMFKTIIFILANKFKIFNIKIINQKCKNLTFVFVSTWNKITSEKDLKIKYNKAAVIPNFIDINMYGFKKKSKEDRFKVLSINNFGNMIYAGDLLQRVIVEFSKEEEFKKFQFSIYGEGKCFNTFTREMRNFENVKIKKGFLKTEQIAKVHREHGIFLYPKRGDSQGVSRCEAMSSGLVPIASKVEAVEEFTPDETAYLVENSVSQFIKAFKFICNNPQDFVRKSIAAAEIVREKCSYDKTIQKEIKLLRGE